VAGKGTGKNKGRISPTKAKKLIKVFEKCGFEVSGQTGSHVIMRKEGHPFNLSIPIHSGGEVQPPLIKNLIKLAGIPKEKFLGLLKKKKG
jgi:predicted RNA binding protein YcfA (HicA-like mRNA interferase family)